MSDPIQLPPVPILPPIAHTRTVEAVEPAQESRTSNRNSGEQQPGREQRPTQISAAPQRQFSITRDPVLKSFVYQSIDAESGVVVWQWPAEEVLRRARHQQALAQGQQPTLDAKA
jgi:hypothetical protein